MYWLKNSRVLHEKGLDEVVSSKMKGSAGKGRNDSTVLLDPSDALGLGLTLCFHLSDPASAQPHRLLHAPLTRLVSSV